MNLSNSGKCNQNQLIAPVFELRTGDPSAVEGQFWYRTDLDKIRFWDGAAVQSVLTETRLQADSFAIAGTFNFSTAPAFTAGGTPFTVTSTTKVTNLNADLLDGFNTGTTATINTIPVRGTGGILQGIGTPGSGTDAANKDYVDANSQGLVVHLPCLVATTANITLSGEQTIDGVLTSASRVLVKNQTNPAENGIRVSGAGAWARATDMDDSAEADAGAYTYIQSGSTQAGYAYVQSTLNPVLDTDPLVFNLFYQAVSYAAGNGLNLTGVTFSLSIDAATTWGANRILYTGTNTVVSLAAGSQYQVLTPNGSSVPTWGQVALNQSAAVTGTLAVGNGGTNSATALNGNRIMITTGGSIVEGGALTNGQLFIGNTGNAPTIASITGTANQVTVTLGAGSITLSLPQNIATGSTPTFAGETLTGSLTSTLGTITASTPAYTSTATWNSAGVTFKHLFANITSTASAAGSLLIDMQVGGVSMFSVRKDGAITAGTIAAASVTAGAALTKTDDTNVTLTLGGSPTTALLAATSITVGWTGTLALSRGGTAANLTAVNGGIVYSTASALAILAAGTLGYVLTSGGAGAPTWTALSGIGVTSITGTANQVIASAATGAVTLSLPQSIATSSTVQFGKVGIGIAPTYLLDVKSASDNILGLIAGPTRGIRFETNATYSQIAGVDQTGAASYQPLWVTGTTLTFGISGIAKATIDANGNFGLGTSPIAFMDIVQPAKTSGSPTAFYLQGGAHTTLAASTEAIDVNVNLGRTVQYAMGLLAFQRAVSFLAPTYAFVGASVLTESTTVYIDKPPTAGTNATISYGYSLLFGDTVTPVIGVRRSTSVGQARGTHFEIHAGDAPAGNNFRGGELRLYGGRSTGTAGGAANNGIAGFVCTAGSSGSTLNTSFLTIFTWDDKALNAFTPIIANYVSTGAAGTAPLKLTPGTVLTAPEVGAVEVDANGILYWTQILAFGTALDRTRIATTWAQDITTSNPGIGTINATTCRITHNRATKDLQVSMFALNTNHGNTVGDKVDIDTCATNVDYIDITYSVGSLASGDYRIVITG